MFHNAETQGSRDLCLVIRDGFVLNRRKFYGADSGGARSELETLAVRWTDTVPSIGLLSIEVQDHVEPPHLIGNVARARALSVGIRLA